MWSHVHLQLIRKLWPKSLNATRAATQQTIEDQKA